MRFLCCGLMSAAPERPCDDIGGLNAFLRETLMRRISWIDQGMRSDVLALRHARLRHDGCHPTSGQQADAQKKAIRPIAQVRSHTVLEQGSAEANCRKSTRTPAARRCERRPAERSRRSPRGPRKERVTFQLPLGLIEKARDVVFLSPGPTWRASWKRRPLLSWSGRRRSAASRFRRAPAPSSRPEGR
jgi:hypothetical protein